MTQRKKLCLLCGCTIPISNKSDLCFACHRQWLGPPWEWNGLSQEERDKRMDNLDRILQIKEAKDEKIFCKAMQARARELGYSILDDYFGETAVSNSST